MIQADRPALTRLQAFIGIEKIPADPSSPLRIKISRIRLAQVRRSSYFRGAPKRFRLAEAHQVTLVAACTATLMQHPLPTIGEKVTGNSFLDDFS